MSLSRGRPALCSCLRPLLPPAVPLLLPLSSALSSTRWRRLLSRAFVTSSRRPRRPHRSPEPVFPSPATARSSSSISSSSASPFLPSSPSEWRSISWGYSLLPRTAIRISGSSASTWLQNLTSNDITTLTREGGAAASPVSAVYTAFLNFKGRVVFDAFVLRADGSTTTAAGGGGSEGEAGAEAYWLLVDSALVETAVRHLGRLNFRRKVGIDVVPDAQVWSLLVPHSLQPSAASVSSTVSSLLSGSDRRCLSWFMDPRTPLLGAVLLSFAAAPLSLPASVPLLHPMVYSLHCALLTIPSSSSSSSPSVSSSSSSVAELQPERSLPLELSLQHLHGVSFSKGCYLGQEVTARAHFQGVLRKRLYTLLLLLPASSSSRSGAAGLSRLQDRRDGDGLLCYRGIDWSWQGGGAGGAAVVVSGAGGAEREIGRVSSSLLNVCTAVLRVEEAEAAAADLRVVMADDAGQRREWPVAVLQADWWPASQQTAEHETGNVFAADQPVTAGEPAPLSVSAHSA